MDSLLPDLLRSLVATGPVAVLLLIAVWWQTKGNQALVTQLNSERGERMDAMEREIALQRQRNDDCEKDRLQLHRQIAALEHGK